MRHKALVSISVGRTEDIQYRSQVASVRPKHWRMAYPARPQVKPFRPKCIRLVANGVRPSCLRPLGRSTAFTGELEFHAMRIIDVGNDGISA